MPNLTIKSDAKTYECLQGENITKILEKGNTNLLFGCKDANCGACLIKILDNQENLSVMQKREQIFLESIEAHSNERLACQCKVLGDVIIDVVE